jgi:hypothetical protein
VHRTFGWTWWPSRTGTLGACCCHRGPGRLGAWPPRTGTLGGTEAGHRSVGPCGHRTVGGWDRELPSWAVGGLAAESWAAGASTGIWDAASVWVHMSYAHRVTDMDSRYPYPRSYYPWVPYSIHTRTQGYEILPYPYPLPSLVPAERLKCSCPLVEPGLHLADLLELCVLTPRRD